MSKDKKEKKKGFVETKHYTQHEIIPGMDKEEHSQTVESLKTNVHDKTTKEHIGDKKTENPFTIDHGTTSA